MKKLLKKLKIIFGSIAFDHLVKRRNYILTKPKEGYFSINDLEIFFLSIRNKLEKKEYKFKLNSDIGLLLYSYEEMSVF